MRILIVDDDRDIRQSLKRSLEADCFAVDTAADGSEGSYLARTNDYDLVILDVRLPKKCGFEVCRDIRESGRTTPIIIVSVQTCVDGKADLLDLGADDYLTKPFAYKELRSRISAVMRRPRAMSSRVLEIADLALDTRDQSVRRGEKRVYLTKKEFALAEYLMRHPGTVMSRGKLMEHVWDGGIDPFSNTVETHIANLRRKIDKQAGQKLIHTVPGRGYMMLAEGYGDLG